MATTSYPWRILDLTHSEDDAPWVEQLLLSRGHEGWEVHQEMPQVKWRLYFPLEGPGHQDKLLSLKEALQEVGSEVTEAGEIRDEDWAENWKEFYHPFPVGSRFVIAPSWEEPPADMARGREVIKLDPGSAFGTGYHESTRLCLQLMEAMAEEDGWGREALLDYGTGSGILGIGALHLGCPHVVCSDRDPIAVSVAQVNLRENGYSDDVFKVLEQNTPEGEYEFVVANLTADILAQLSIPLASACKRHLVLGGIVDKRAQKVVDAYTEQGATMLKRLQENDWVAFYFRFDR